MRATAPPAAAGAAAPYEPIFEGLHAWLARAERVVPALARDGGRLREQHAEVRATGARVEAPLVILLAGGTGAGKSTLLNALAGGAEIAAASAVRPTTTALTCYYHLRNELAIPREAAGARRAGHERPELLDKVILDAPDFDSSARGNEAVLRRALAETDLVVCLATPEKYADADLHALLDEYRTGRAFVFALNRLDRGIAPEVVEDFRRELARAGFEPPRLRVLSALAALRRKRGERDPGPEGDFRELERIIEEELTRARVRELKRLNLDALVGRLIDRAAARLPADLERRLARWRRAGEANVDEARARAGARLAASVRGDEALEAEATARFATRYGGPFGFWQALVWGVRGLRGARPAVVLARPAEPDDEGTEAAAVALAARRAADLGAEHGLAASNGSALPPGEAERLVAAARVEADAAIARALQGLQREASRGALRRVESFLLSLPPLAVLGYALWRWIERFLEGELYPTSWIVAAGLVTAAVLAIEGALADALARRRARALIRRLEDAAAAAADERIARPLLTRLEGALGEVEGVARGIEDLREVLGQARSGTR